MYDVNNHRLSGPQVSRKPLGHGAMIEPRFILMHYTAGGAIDGSWRALQARGLSAHLLIERNGEALQCVDFNRKAFHAGRSEWNGVRFLNGHSIGVELCNYGWLFRKGPDSFQRPETFGATPVFRGDEVLAADHKNGWPRRAGWELYPAAQLRAAFAICRALINAYPSIEDILGHDDVSPDRKQDPGPAFPISDFRGLLDDCEDASAAETPPPPGPCGRRCPAMVFGRHVVTAKTGLNVRSGPGADNPVVHVLRGGQQIRCADDGGAWLAVDRDADGRADGFVHRAFVKAA